MRFLVLLLALSAATNSFSSRQVEGDALQQQRTFDPIVTGQRVSAEDLTAWKHRKALKEACPDCIEKQPFPGDLPATDARLAAR